MSVSKYSVREKHGIV